MDSSENVTNNVRSYRRNKPNITQQEPANLVGVTRQTIVAIERGKYNPSVGLAKKSFAPPNRSGIIAGSVAALGVFGAFWAVFIAAFFVPVWSAFRWPKPTGIVLVIIAY